MKNLPTLARDIYAEHINEKGEVVWPERGEDRSELARVLYGRQLVDTFDYWFSHAIDLIENPQPQKVFPRKNEAYKEDKYFRDQLSTLSDEQKLVVRNLVQTIAHGILFGTLVDLDQGDYGEVELTMKLGERDDQTVRVTPDKPVELHDELSDWVLSFSKFADEIAELVETKYGWEFQRKKFY